MKLILNWTSFKLKKIDGLFVPFIVFILLTLVLPSVLMCTHSFRSLSDIQQAPLTSNIFFSFGISTMAASVALVVTLFLSFVLAFLIWSSFSSKWRKRLLLLLCLPLVTNYFIKLIGLKSCFDFFNGHQNSTYGIQYTIVGLVYLSLPLVTYNFINTFFSIPVAQRRAIRDLGQTSWGEIIHLLLPWSKTTFLSSSILFFLPSLFTTFISEFLNHDNGTRMIGEVITSLSNNIWAEGAKPFIVFLVSLLFTISVFFVVFWVSFYKFVGYQTKRVKNWLYLKAKRENIKQKSMQLVALNPI